jgi:hypothetical protein
LTGPARASKHYPLEIQLLPPPSHGQHSSRTISPRNHRPAEANTAAPVATNATTTKPTHERGRQKANRTESAAQFYGFYLEPNAKLLEQRRITQIKPLQPGLHEGQVGLLPGLNGEFMRKYEVKH